MSVAGFDDSDLAFLLGITSLDFNAHGLVHALLHHLFDPGHTLGGGPHDPPIEVESTVVHRSSTARMREQLR